MFHILLSPHTHLICLPTQTTVSRLRQSEVNNMDVVMSLFSFAVNVWVGLGGGVIPSKQDEEIHFTWRVLLVYLSVCAVITLRAAH